MTESNNQPPTENETPETDKLEEAKKIANQTKEKAKESLDAAKEKFESAGGVDGMKKQCNGFFHEIKEGFQPTDSTTGLKALVSRFKNLWLSGWQGKAVEIILVVILATTVLPGGNSPESEAKDAAKTFLTSMKKGNDKFIKMSMGSMKSFINQSISSQRAALVFADFSKPKVSTLRVLSADEAEARCKYLGGHDKWFVLKLAKVEKKWFVTGYEKAD